MAIRQVDSGTNPTRYEDDYKGSVIEISVGYDIQSDAFGFHVYVIKVNELGRRGERTKIGGMLTAGSVEEAQHRGLYIGRVVIDA
ncbi:hypothetical protein [Burkholderia gladioli]|uniref:hypothetical protein n=1 Tax=Burkholderia gladioli TaxID=28095 RepID=UPI001641414B|nr:hypothetical protein [Burkholderia gladioli]